MSIFYKKVQMPFLLKYHIVLLYICVFSHSSVSYPRKMVYCTIHGSAKTIRLPSEIEQQNYINLLHLFISGTGNANLTDTSGHTSGFVVVLRVRDYWVLFCFLFIPCVCIVVSCAQRTHFLDCGSLLVIPIHCYFIFAWFYFGYHH